MVVASAREYVWNQNANVDPLHTPAEAASFVSLDGQYFRTLLLYHVKQMCSYPIENFFKNFENIIEALLYPGIGDNNAGI